MYDLCPMGIDVDLLQLRDCVASTTKSWAVDTSKETQSLHRVSYKGSPPNELFAGKWRAYLLLFGQIQQQWDEGQTQGSQLVLSDVLIDLSLIHI